MFDGITPSEVPAGAAIYAGYVNGTWPSYAAIKAQHPGKLYVSISVNASGRAKCLDVEKGDASPDQAPGWVLDQRAAGDPHPWVYMNESTWPTVQAAFTTQKVVPPLWWVAGYVTNPLKQATVPAGSIGIQDYDFGGYDRSIMSDYIVGLDPVPVPPAPPAPTPTPEEIEMLKDGVIYRVKGAPEVYFLHPSGRFWHIDDLPELEFYIGLKCLELTTTAQGIVNIQTGK